MKVPVVLEYQFGIILTAKGFMNSKRGICLAEEYFVETARQAGMDMDENTVQMCLEDGLYEQGDYQLWLIYTS